MIGLFSQRDLNNVTGMFQIVKQSHDQISWEGKNGQLTGKFRDRCNPQPEEWLKVNLIRKSNTLQVRSMNLWDDTVVSP